MDIKPFEKDIKAVILDVDGTLLNDDHALSERNREVIRKAIDAGVTVILATGKTRAGTASVIEALDLKTPGVYVQGLIIYNADGTIRRQTKLEVNAARHAIQYAEQNGFDIIAYSGDRLLVKNKAEHLDAITRFHEPEPVAVGNLVNKLDGTPINKLIVMGNSMKKLRALRWQLNQQIGEHVSFTEAAMLTSIEILPKNSNKGQGVLFLLKELGITPTDVMAVGDAENDVEMLKLVGLPVAIGNARDAVKAVAQEVVASNNDDGVAEAIERFVLKQAAEDKADDEQPADATPETPPKAEETPSTEESSS